MTLPASGTITFNNINVELSVSGTTARSLNDAAVRSLAGIGSGAISMANLHGKSAATFNPNANGNYGAYTLDASSNYTITCTANATWTYVLAGGGSAGGSVNRANNAVANSITFTQAVGDVSGTYRINSWSVTGVSGSTTRTYYITMEAERS